MKKHSKTFVFYMGILVFVIGLLFKFLIPESEGAMESLPSVMTGFGAGIMSVGVVGIYRKRMLEKNPEKARQYEIAEKDERNIRIREKSGYATWYVSLFILAILSLALLIFDYKIPCFLTIGVLFIHIISMLVFANIYDKKI